MTIQRTAGLAGLLGILWTASAYAACVGGGLSFTCPAGSSPADIQSALDAAADGATITCAAGAYSWNSWIQFSNIKGVTLRCSSASACAVDFAGTVLGMNGTLSGTNTHLYRISGFTFQNNPGAADVIWFDGNGEMTQIRVDHNVFSNLAEGSVCVFFGDTLGIANYYGVIDHNTLTTGSSSMLMHMIGAENPSPPPSPQGTGNNMFVEDNTITITTMTNAGEGCADSWGGAQIVWRHNTNRNCLVTSHGVVHAGGPQNYELYDNDLGVDAGSVGQGFEDCYRCFHHQGSGEFLAFNNRFTAFSGKNGDPLGMTHYRSALPADAGYGDPPGRCDGSKAIDGNRAPVGTYFGYPCWHQPGRDFAGHLMPMYVWNNRWADTGGKIDMTVENPWGAVNPSVDDHLKADRDYYNAVAAGAQTSPASPFNGTTGMGFGTMANRPATCTAGTESGGGVGYFATDQGPQGTLYRCSAANTWTQQYVPYVYPHPLVSGLPVPTPTATPAGRTASFSPRVYPNPWRADRDAGSPRMLFDNIAGTATVKIYTAAGHLIKTLGPGAVPRAWVLDNEAGQKVPSGVYLYLVTYGSGQASGKIAVVR